MISALSTIMPDWQFILIMALSGAILITVCLIFYSMSFSPLKEDGRNQRNELRHEMKRILKEKRREKEEMQRAVEDAERTKEERERLLEEERQKRLERARRRLMQEGGLEEKEFFKKGLIESGATEENAELLASAPLSRLILIKKQKTAGISDDLLANSITRRVLLDDGGEAVDYINDFKIPKCDNYGYLLSDINSYMQALEGAERKDARNRSSSFLIAGRSFALSKETGEGKFSVALKCGLAYAGVLAEYYGGCFNKSDFPYGMFWFKVSAGGKTVAEEGGNADCSLEQAKLLVFISYNLSKAGI